MDYYVKFSVNLLIEGGVWLLNLNAWLFNWGGVLDLQFNNQVVYIMNKCALNISLVSSIILVSLFGCFK